MVDIREDAHTKDEAPAAPRAIAAGDDRPMFAGLAPTRKRRFLFF